MKKLNIKKLCFLITALVCLLAGKGFGQDVIRIATWNIENFNKYKSELRNYVDFAIEPNNKTYLNPTLQYPEKKGTSNTGKLPGTVIDDFPLLGVASRYVCLSAASLPPIM